MLASPTVDVGPGRPRAATFDDHHSDDQHDEEEVHRRSVAAKPATSAGSVGFVGARSEIETVDQPWPVVFDALVQSLPTKRFRVTGVDPARGRISLETRNARLELAVGAVDAITTEWVATSEQKFGIVPERHDAHFASIRDALDTYLAAYYP